MRNKVETINYKGYEIDIYPDELGEDPRDWDNLGIMRCGNLKYTLGDVQIKRADFISWDDEYKKIEKEGGLLIMPLKIYDHSGVSISTDINSYPFNDRWDSSFVGYIYTTRERLKRDGLIKAKKITKKVLAQAKKILLQEVEVYSDWMQGSVYYYEIKDKKYEREIGGCGGFYGFDWKENGLLREAQADIDAYILRQKDEKKKTAEKITKAIYG